METPQTTQSTQIIEESPIIAGCDAFGRPVDIELLEMVASELPGTGITEAEANAQQISATHARGESDIETGVASKRALVALGCGKCVLHRYCPIEGALINDVETKAALAEMEQSSEMLITAPRWLTNARLRRLVGSDITEERAKQLLDDRTALSQALANEEIDKISLRSGVSNEFIGMVSKEAIPEVRHLKSFKDTDSYAIERVTTDKGNVFDVIDASVHSGHKGSPIGAGEYMILTEKLLSKMSETDKGGQPQIFHADGTIQKSIHGATPAKGCGVFEIRMSDKDRLYVSVRQPQTPDEPVRIVLLGSHGGDESSQNKFVNNVLHAKAGNLVSVQ